MREENFDRILSGEDNIVPSSGFTSSVIEAVRRDAAAPPPIPFPWRWALPGLGWCLAAYIASLFTAMPSIDIPPAAPSALDLSMLVRGAGWMGGAFALSLASVALSVGIARRF